MVKTYALFKTKPKLSGDNCVRDISDTNSFIICARQTNKGIFWMNNFDILSDFIKEDTFVYCLDNSNIKNFTFNDLKTQINGN